MSLIGNGFRENTLGKLFGGTSLNGANPSVHEYRGHLTARMRNQFAGEGDFSTSASVPDGCRHPVAWIMPQKPGGLSARNTITGAGTVSATAQSGYNIAAALTGAGGITGSAGLIVSIAATLIASGGISSAQVDALASMVATITGSGDVTATAAGLADLGAVLTGTGTVDASNTALMDIVATIRGYGDLTPEGLRDAVWNAIATGYNDSGTMGEKLNAAGAAGNPWIEVIESGLTAAEILRLIAAAVQGNATGLENGSPVFKGLDGTTDRITATYVSGTRTVTGRDGS